MITLAGMTRTNACVVDGRTAGRLLRRHDGRPQQVQRRADRGRPGPHGGRSRGPLPESTCSDLRTERAHASA